MLQKNKLQAKDLLTASTQAWENRLAAYTKNIPLLESNIEGLEDYYKRSVISGMVCIWENPSFILNPFLATCGMDGGGMCSYVWDIAGYSPQMATLMIDSSIVNIAKMMTSIDLEKYHVYTPGGDGVGTRYAYSTWSFTSLVSTIFKHIDPDLQLFNSAKTLILNDETRKSENYLIDYGVKKNLLEMRGTGWEHFVVSPNSERSWCLEQLAAMSKEIKHDYEKTDIWYEEADKIKHSVRSELWNDEVIWFASVYPNGFKDLVFRIQVYDALREGVCIPEIEEALISHFRDGAFLGKYGITSISWEDSIHYEVFDTDWSGGRAYTGDGPQLALIMY